MHYLASLHDERDLKKADLFILIHFPVINALKDIFDGHDIKKVQNFCTYAKINSI
jgi:hypothetical protein